MVGKNGYLLDELFYQSLIKLRDVSFLFGDEALQLLDSVHGLFPVVAVNFGLFLLLPEAENLIGDGVVVLLVVCLLDKLFLQFFQPSLDAVRREGVSADYSLGATKGGEITHFTDFDIHFNQQISLLETRCSGALTRVKSAIALEMDVTEADDDSDPNNESGNQT